MSLAHPYALSFPYVSTPNSATRPSLGRQDSDAFLSYYGSSDAGRTYVPQAEMPEKGVRLPCRNRDIPSPSTSSFSEYSSDSPIGERADYFTMTQRDPSPSDGRQCRESVLSEGGSDRRRLAIIQMDSSKEGVWRSKTSSDPGHDNTISDSLRRRRGLGSLKGLALVAPPDASPKTYMYMTPPSSAPIISEGVSHSRPNGEDPPSGHQRSQSEAVGVIKRRGLTRALTHKGSREVGIVGTSHSPVATESSKQTRSGAIHEALRPPIFQLPQSRSPSPGAISDHSHSSSLSAGVDTTPVKSSSNRQTILTPEIGQRKNINVPVAAPVVINLAPDSLLQAGVMNCPQHPTAPNMVVQQLPSPYSAASKALYLNYQPGVHATAGPLPPPPRAIFNVDPKNSPPPPRPPRLHSPLPTRRRGDMDAVKQALQLPSSVTAILASGIHTPSLKQTPSHPSNADITEQYNSPDHSHISVDTSKLDVKPVHKREGAISPSTLSPGSTTRSDSETSKLSPKQSENSVEDLIADITNAINDVEIINAGNMPPPAVIEPPHHDEKVQTGARVGLCRDDSWTDLSAEVFRDTTPSSRRKKGTSAELLPRPSSYSPHRQGYDENAPSPPSKSPRSSLRNSFVNLKRFSSLPRTPSMKSGSLRSDKSRFSRTPSPPTEAQSLPPPPVQKIRSTWPQAMDAADVLRKRNSLDRSVAYAHKINELYIYDCGLHDWVMEARYRGLSNQRAVKWEPATASGPSDPGLMPQPRHTSRSSMVSQATFPRRLDATTATDLSFRFTEDVTPPTAPPPLPYPSLAQNLQRGLPSRSATVGGPSSMRTPTSNSLSVKSSGGFFASLGRKTSLKKGSLTHTSGPTSSPTTSSKVLTKNPPANYNPRTINISSAPSVPGGPRAAPHRVQRSQTVVISAPFKPISQANNSTPNRRLSIMDPSSDRVIDIQPTPEFSRQVDKLADLLPHADRVVLAGYLRRAGQDMLAIGQYLEDEKNGTIRLNQ